MKNEKKRWCTNKALFEKNGNVVKKSYFRVGNAFKDYLLLTLIKKYYPKKLYCGYWYNAIETCSCCQKENSFKMRFIDGKSLKEAFYENKRSDVFFHAGYWLGIFHKATKDQKGRVMVFNDYNVSNILIDTKKKIVVALDPGNYSTINTNPSNSIFIIILSIVRCVFKKNIKYILPSVKAFFHGYWLSGEKNKIKLESGARYLMHRFKNGESRTLINEPKFARMITGIMETFAIYSIIFYEYRLK